MIRGFRMVSQEEITGKLRQIFGDNNVSYEWDVAKESADALTREMYCPRVDIAVGPFNINRDIGPNRRRIWVAYENHRALIEAIRARSDAANRELVHNPNPRCLVAIEVEHYTGTKHRLGSMINASAIGDIGIIVAASPAVFNSLVRIRRYVEFLLTVGKTDYDPRNLMIVLADDLGEVLDEVI